MTHLGGFGDDPANRPDGDAKAAALEIADAVDGLTDLWLLAAQEARLRLSLQQLRALRVVAAEPGLNLTTLAERLEMGLPTASRLCDRLEAAGLLERVLHPRKRREVQLSLSAQGRQVLDEVAGRRAQGLAEVLEAMEAADRAALRRGMRAFRAVRDAGAPHPHGPDRT
ncbi:MarR family winged helix-turn-helix transcriptional regulator [Streptomyces sp. NPDC014864]|uniref:MarR family winged helix-turn-helix transcriptional regulator n=1 Tax=Streptomyces sp. NPDC014864 TaxID=3364924 RepID=UPI0036FD4FD8